MPVYFPTTSGSSGSSGPANTYNLSPLNLVKTRRALARVKTGTANARILCVGDSTTFSSYSNGGSLSGDQNANAWPTRLAQLLTSAGYAATSDTFFGGGQGTSNDRRAGRDGRLSFGGGWTCDTDLTQLLGGVQIKTTTTGVLSFTPAAQADTFTVWYTVGGGGATNNFSIDINGSGTTNVSTLGSNALGSSTITSALGSNTLNITWLTGQAVICGISAYNSAAKSIQLFNCGAPGIKTGQLVSTFPWSALSAITTLAADLVIINLGINDWLFSTSLSSYQTSLQGVITAAKNGGSDVILMTPNPTDFTYLAGTQAQQQAFVNVIYALAASNNVPLIDVWNRWQSYNSVSGPLGLYGSDGINVHPNQLGYNDMARLAAHAILSV